jgi:CRISPR system Cascade subunit CasB
MTGMEELATAVDALTGAEQRFFDLDRAEEALNLAVTLWALHQQSQHGQGMHQLPWFSKGNHERRQGLGTAVRELMRATSGSTEVDEPLRKRFVRVAGATSLEAFAQRLRDIVLLLRREAIPLDYGLLADQIYRWQSPAGRTDVHREWGRDFHVSAVGSDSRPLPPEALLTTE